MILWVKTLHLLFVIAWLAGVFYLPRILVHLAEGRSAGEDTRRLVIMAEKLFRFSVVMALIALLSGLALWLGYGITGGWLHAKLLLVVLLIAYQGRTFHYIGRMKRGEAAYTSRFFRVYNEAALLLVIPILALAIMKPF